MHAGGPSVRREFLLLENIQSSGGYTGRDAMGFTESLGLIVLPEGETASSRLHGAAPQESKLRAG
jgi:hypothetical protein